MHECTLCVFIVSINSQRTFGKEGLWCEFHTFRKRHGRDLNSSISHPNSPTGSKGKVHDRITLLDTVKLRAAPPHDPSHSAQQNVEAETRSLLSTHTYALSAALDFFSLRASMSLDNQISLKKGNTWKGNQVTRQSSLWLLLTIFPFYHFK